VADVKILLVDDEETLLEISKLYIERMDENFHIQPVKSATEALKLLKKEPFDVIISDYQMPDIDGLKFLSILREQENDIPFIIFTGKGREEVAIQALNLGADYYLQKGGETETQFHELANLIRKLVNQKQAEKARLHLLNQQITINKLAVTLGESRDLNKIYKTIFQHIYSIMDADTFVVSFFDGKKKIISPGYALINRKVIDITIFPALPLDHPENQIRKKVIENNNFVYLEDLRKKGSKKREEPTGSGEYTKSAVYVPMKIGGEVIGIMEVHSYRANAYSQQDIELLAALANVAAVAIQNARLFNLQREINEQLRQEKERTQSFLDLIEVLILVLDKDGIVQRINRKGCELLGYTEEEVIGKNWFENFLSEEQQDKIKKRVRKIIAKREIQSRNINPVLTKDGTEIMISWKSSVLPEFIDGKECVLSTGVEITEEIVKETERLQEEEHYKYLAQMSDEGLIIVEKNKIRYINDNMRRILGLSPGEVNFDPLTFLCEEDQKRFLKVKDAIQKGGDFPKEFQYCIFSRNKVKKYLNSVILVVKMSGGYNRLYIRTKDITERKLAEKALEASERKYRITFDAFSDPMHVVDRNLRINIYNKAMKDWLAKLNLDITLDGKTVFEAFPFLPKKVHDEYDLVFRTGESHYSRDGVILKGKEVITETRKIPIIEKEKVTAVITIIRDVTKEAKIEKQLRENEKNLRLLFDNSSDGILILDSNDNIIEINEKAIEILSKTKEQIIETDFKGYLNKKAIKIFEDFKQILKTKKNATAELEITSDTNNKAIAEISGTEISKIKDKNVLQILIRDISQRKIAERNRLKYINNLRFLSTTAMDFIAHQGEEEIYTYICEKVSAILKGAVVLLFTVDNTKDKITIKYISPIGKPIKLLEKAIKREIIGLTVKLTPKMKEMIKGRGLFEIKENYAEIIKDYFPKKIVQNSLKTLKVKHIYAKCFRSNNETFSGINIFMRNGKKLEQNDLLETFLNQTSVALERLYTRMKLQLSEEQFRELIETMSDGLAIDDLKGNFVYVNPKFCEMLGYSPEEILGTKVIDFVDITESKISSHLRNGRLSSKSDGKSYEITWITKTGKKLPTLISPKNIYDTSGEIIGSFAVITDITEQKKFEYKLKEQQKLLQQQRDELESFATTIAHDLRGKMQVISLYNSLAEHEYSDKIADSIEEMTTFVEDLLFLARKGEALGKLTNVKLASLVEPLQAKIAKLEPKLEIECKKLPIVIADKIRLKQVFENLLMNVVKHAEATKLKIYSREDKGFHFITIEDNGKGIPAKIRKAIIESWKTNRYTSFGMLIIYKIVKAHGGDIVLESTEGKGTKITFSLPKKVKGGQE